MRSPLAQAAHIIYEIGYVFFSLLSRTINATFFKGSMHQTLSARAHIEARYDKSWVKLEKRINRLFFWQENHCSEAWLSEVTRARKTLIRNGDLPKNE